MDSNLRVDGDLASSSIQKHVKDILGGDQNEVLQSFVHTEHANGQVIVAPADTTSSLQVPQTHMDTKPDRTKPKDESKRPTSPSPIQYHQLGKDSVANQKMEIPTVGRRRGAGKWSRRQRLMEEVYTDKDRAAAVNMGSRDIKQSLKLKRKQDRSRVLEISEEAHPGTLLALGQDKLNKGDLVVALNFIHKALELNPYDKNALVARSKCHLLMGNPQAALEDAQHALADDKTFVRGLYQKAEALYHLGEFEYSLVYFHRGLHIRPQMNNFKSGVHKAQQAILNTIGKSVPCFTNILLAKKKHVTQMPISEHHVPSTNNSNMAQSKRLLKELHVDHVYLYNLLRNPDLKCADGCSVEKTIVSEVLAGVQFLENRQQFWRQQQAPKKYAINMRNRYSSKNSDSFFS